MGLNLVVLTSYFAFEPKNIMGGIGYRYVGLYGSLVKVLLKSSPKSKVFWYSHSDYSLRIINQTGIQRVKATMLKAIMSAFSDALKSGSHLAVIMAFPYAVPRIEKIFEYIFCLGVLKIFSFRHIKVIVDDFDPPVEAAYAFSETEPSGLAIIFGRILEILTLKLSSSIITVSESFKHYIARIYRIRNEKILVVTNGSLIRGISYFPPRTEGPLTILYSGSAMKVKDVDKLLLAVNRMRKRDIKVLLILTGGKLMNIPHHEWIVHKKIDDWRSYVKTCLEASDICVIPYPCKLFWDYTVLAKLCDYMAAGKPIISTNLKETSNIIRMYNCGLVARDWQEFELHLERLYQDRELARKLGKNGRKAAEKHFNYELLAEALLAKLVKMFDCHKKRFFLSYLVSEIQTWKNKFQAIYVL